MTFLVGQPWTVDGDGNTDHIVISSDGTRAYLYEGAGMTPPPSGYDPPSVETIDLTTMNPVGRTVPVGNQPGGMALTPDGRHLYVCDSLSDTVTVIDTQRSAVAATLHTGYCPEAVAITRDGTRAYVLGGTGTITVIDTSHQTTSNFRVTLTDQQA